MGDGVLLEELSQQMRGISRRTAVGGVGSVADHNRVAAVLQRLPNHLGRAETPNVIERLPQVPTAGTQVVDGPPPAGIAAGGRQRDRPTVRRAIQPGHRHVNSGRQDVLLRFQLFQPAIQGGGRARERVVQLGGGDHGQLPPILHGPNAVVEHADQSAGGSLSRFEGVEMRRRMIAGQHVGVLHHPPGDVCV